MDFRSNLNKILAYTKILLRLAFIEATEAQKHQNTKVLFKLLLMVQIDVSIVTKKLP